MKAIRLHGYGGIDQLRYEETEDPQLTSPVHVLVKLKAASVNELDVAIRRGRSRAPRGFPHVLGSDASGTIVAVGSEVRGVKPGDDVCLYPATSCGVCDACRDEQEHMCGERTLLGEVEAGTYAEYISLPARNCYPIPVGMSFEEAAALPVAYTSAWRMLIGDAELRPGEWVVVKSLRPGVTAAALEIAVSVGARVIVTSSSEEALARAARLGARYGIDERAADFVREIRDLTRKHGADVLVDCAGGEGWCKNLSALARGGRLVAYGPAVANPAQTDLRRIFWNHLKVLGSTLGTRADFGKVLNYAAGARARPLIDEVIPLKDAARAHERMESGKGLGKIVLSMESS